MNEDDAPTLSPMQLARLCPAVPFVPLPCPHQEHDSSQAKGVSSEARLREAMAEGKEGMAQ